MARAFIESGSSHVAIVDLNEADSKTAAKDMTEWFGKSNQLKTTSGMLSRSSGSGQ